MLILYKAEPSEYLQLWPFFTWSMIILSTMQFQSQGQIANCCLKFAQKKKGRRKETRCIALIPCVNRSTKNSPIDLLVPLFQCYTLDTSGSFDLSDLTWRIIQEVLTIYIFEYKNPALCELCGNSPESDVGLQKWQQWQHPQHCKASLLSLACK